MSWKSRKYESIFFPLPNWGWVRGLHHNRAGGTRGSGGNLNPPSTLHCAPLSKLLFERRCLSVRPSVFLQKRKFSEQTSRILEWRLVYDKPFHLCAQDIYSLSESFLVTFKMSCFQPNFSYGPTSMTLKNSENHVIFDRKFTEFMAIFFFVFVFLASN